MDRGYTVERNIHPKDSASVSSLFFFSYIFSYIKKGNRKDLEEDDVCRVWTKLLSKNSADEMEELWNHQREKKAKKKSLIKLLFQCYWKTYLAFGCIQLFFNFIYVLLTPHAVGKLVSYFREGQTEMTKNDAWIYSGIVILTNFVFLFYEHHYSLLKTELGLQIAASVSSMIYRKTLRLSVFEIDNISAGKFVTAITKDILQLGETANFINDLWVESIISCVIIYLLHTKVGPSGVTGLSIVVIIIIIQIYVASLMVRMRRVTNKMTDERLNSTKEIITSIKVLKMYAWEKIFAKRIIDAREKEMGKLKFLAVLKYLSLLLGNLSNKLSFLLIILFYIWFGNNLTSEVVYYLSTLFYKLRNTLAIIIPACSGKTTEFLASVNRIEQILTADEIVVTSEKNLSLKLSPRIQLKSVDVVVQQTKILTNLNIELKTGLNILIGSAGSGKSSLVKAILREYEPCNGKIGVEGSISYCSQNPWLFPSSIRQNILFGLPYDEKKYRHILEISCLSFDLSYLAEKDETILTDCGVNLSKGQQARVNIARALYKNSNIYIFDDCLSSLDTHVKQHIFEHGVQNYLRDKLTLFVTHDNNYVNRADTVILMSDGTVIYYGKPADIPQQMEQYHNFGDSLYESMEDQEDEGQNEEKLCDQNEELLPLIRSVTKANIYYEIIQNGSISWKDYKKYFSFGGGFTKFFIVFGIFVLAESLMAHSKKVMTEWVVFEENLDLRDKENLNSTHYFTRSGLKNITSSSEIYEPTEIYSEYSTYSTQKPNENYSYGENSSMVDCDTNLDGRTNYIYSFSSLMIITCVLVFTASSLYFIFSLKISKHLHNSMISNIVFAKISFFDENMSGNILNRFSKDLHAIDELIPDVISEAMRIVTILASVGALIASINLFLAVMTLGLVFILLLVCHYCIKPARSLRRLGMAARSPIVGHLTVSLEGLLTIRAHGTQSVLVNEFDKYQDHLLAANHLFEILMRYLAFSLHMFSAVYIALIILGFLLFQDESSGNVGLAITQSFHLSHFLDYSLRQWIMLESLMTSFQRAAEYADVEQESQTGQVISNWPTRGTIQYRNVSLTYRQNSETVLRNVNFSVEPMEKIGIVGRTGAGKSSLISSLFRLYEVNGDITIDDVDIKTLSLRCLRSQINVIPQDCIVFSGTVRENIDPLQKYTDVDIWQVLDDVKLKYLISDLDRNVRETGLIHSLGQKQLLSLARAIIRKPKILILDEATANMDKETDRLITGKINEMFGNCTIINVANRMQSVMKCDRVLVVDRGQILEFANPEVLLENEQSVFYRMVHHNKNS